MTREEAIVDIRDNIKPVVGGVSLDMAIEALEQTPKTWGLDDAREDFMSDVYNTLDFLPTNNEANRIIDSFDRVTSGLNQQPCEDCISREEALMALTGDITDCTIEEFIARLRDKLSKLPSVGKDINVTTNEDCISRQEAINCVTFNEVRYKMVEDIKALPSVTSKEKTKHCKDCKWWKDNDGVYRRGVGAESRCPINRKEVYEGNGYCFLFELQKSEDKE